MAETETMVAELPPRKTRAVRIGTIEIGAGRPIAVQSMTATKTTDIDATTRQINDLVESGADVVRVAVDSRKDAEALAEISRQTKANLSVDLQENYRLAELVAPFVDKLRYNPGHLYHHERSKPWQEKVRYIAGVAAENDCAMRVGVNCGSVDPDKKEGFDPADSISPMMSSALDHCELLDRIGFTRYCVSLKDSDPAKVIDVNRRFAESRPDVPLHLGVTEAGMPPDGIIKTRIAFEQLISRGIGDTIRVSLTVPNNRKGEEIVAGPEDSRRHRRRPGADRGRFRPQDAQHHQLPELLAGGERGLYRSGRAGEGNDHVRARVRHHDRRDGLPRERAGRDRRCRLGPMVRPELRQSEARRHRAGRFSLRRNPAPA